MERIQLETPKSGSQLVLETLKNLGVDTIFGYPGGAVGAGIGRYLLPVL